MTLSQKSDHLARCALAALAFARQDGTLCSAAQESIFLTRWLATVLKQHRFSREVAPPTLSGCWNRGVSMELEQSLPVSSTTSGVPVLANYHLQNDLFRLTYALETAKDMGWAYRLLSDQEWSERYATVLNAAVNGIYMSRPSLDAAFDDNGQQLTPVMARMTGLVQGLERLLNRCGWQMAVSGASGLHELTAEKTD